jgi:hypothetical protein
VGDEGLEQFAKRIKTVLARVGLSDPERVTVEVLADLEPDLFLQIDERNIESLFFEVTAKTRKRIGKYQPISFAWLLKNTRQPSSQPENGTNNFLDLDFLQWEQRTAYASSLDGIGVSAHELIEMQNSTPERRQNVNRLGFMILEEPSLSVFVKKLPEHTAKRDAELPVERLVRMAQIVLRFKIQRLEKVDSAGRWDAIDHYRYKEVVKRMRNSINLGNLILKNMTLKDITKDDIDDAINRMTAN